MLAEEGKRDGEKFLIINLDPIVLHFQSRIKANTACARRSHLSQGDDRGQFFYFRNFLRRSTRRTLLHIVADCTRSAPVSGLPRMWSEGKGVIADDQVKVIRIWMRFCYRSERKRD